PAANAPPAATDAPDPSAGAASAAPPDWRRQQRDDWNTARATRGLSPVDGNFWDILLLRAADSPAPDSLLMRAEPEPGASSWVYRFRYDRTSATPRPPAAPTAPAAA